MKLAIMSLALLADGLRQSASDQSGDRRIAGPGQ